MSNFKNLVFDLGNVIIDIDYQLPIAEFQKLVPADSGLNFSSIVSYSTQHKIFDLFEKGQISVPQFRTELRQFLKQDVLDSDIDLAWNSILLTYPKEKFDMLLELKKRYRTFALSNINELHVDAIDVAAREKFGLSKFADFFNAAYYSNEVGYRKPEPQIYEILLRAENLKPEETFFVDDKQENIEAARALGIQAYHLAKRDKLQALLTELHIL
jgi:putative hydrolase of the HAD superfamily